MFKKGCGVEMKRMQEGLLVSPGLFSFFGRIMISKLLLKKKKKKKKKKKIQWPVSFSHVVGRFRWQHNVCKRRAVAVFRRSGVSGRFRAQPARSFCVSKSSRI
jgi:hypothetical protein